MHILAFYCISEITFDCYPKSIVKHTTYCQILLERIRRKNIRGVERHRLRIVYVHYKSEEQITECLKCRSLNFFTTFSELCSQPFWLLALVASPCFFETFFAWIMDLRFVKTAGVYIFPCWGEVEKRLCWNNGLNT